MKRLFFLLLILIMFTFQIFSYASELTDPESDAETAAESEEIAPELAETARNAVVYETLSGQILFEKNIHERVPVASLTKIMTALLVIEHGGFDELVTAKETAFFDITSDGSTQNIVTGETMSVEDLLYCLMISSANESSNILAEYVSGSVEVFLEEMNARARALGCTDTNFANTHGLPDDNHYSSAYDMMLITQEAMKHPLFAEIANTTAKTIPPTNKTDRTRDLFTTNHLISTRIQPGYIYHLAMGVKTGYTSKAGYCLSSSAVNDGMSLITIVLGCPRIDDVTMSFIETKKLMEWAFDSFSYRQILNRVSIIDSVKVELGKDHSEVNVVPQRSMTALIPKDLDPEDIERRITLPDSVTAPVGKEQILGQMVLSHNGTVYGTVPLVASFEVELSAEENFMENVREAVNQEWIRYAVAAIIGIILLYAAVVIIYNYARRTQRVRGNYRGKKRRRR
ncbi:MAG: D-alanyl-D-alanine carboxypeptidase [Oscillospiraceae bacterium]|nr:D-alanyl-D-alanine carboxypeptidase [Oscillospiraceae bacterium]